MDVSARLDWAARTSAAVLFAAMVQQTTTVELPAFGAFVAVMALERNVGRTVANVRACIVGSGIAAAVCTLWLFLFSSSAVVMHFVHAGTCFALARWASLPTMAQKLGLSLLPLTLINGFNPGSRQDLELPLDLFITTLMGCGCALVASLLPLPQLSASGVTKLRPAAARERVVDGRGVSLELLALLLRSLVAAFCATPGEANWRARVRRDALGGVLQREAKAIASRAKDAQWEAWLPRCGARAAPFDDVALSESLLAATEGVHVAEEAIKDNTSTAVMSPFLGYLRPPLQESLDAVEALLERLRSGDLPEAAAHAVAVEGVIAAQARLQAEYRRARHDIYYKKGARAVPITQDALLSLNVFLFYYNYTVQSVVAVAQRAGRHPANDGEVVGSSRRSALSTVTASCGNLAAELTGTCRTIDPMAELRLRSPESKAAFKIALAMALASLFDASAGRHDPPPALAAFTVAYVCLSPTLSGNVTLAKLRLGGTVAGSIFSSIALGLPAVRNNRAALLLLLCLFVFAAAYVRSSATHSYAGTVAAFTAPVLLLEFNDPNVRIEHTVVGICIFVAVDVTIFAQQSTTLARRKLTSALENLDKALCALYAGFGPEPQQHAPPRALEELAVVGNVGEQRRGRAPELARAVSAPAKPTSHPNPDPNPKPNPDPNPSTMNPDPKPNPGPNPSRGENGEDDWRSMEHAEQVEARALLLVAARRALPDEGVPFKAHARRLLAEVAEDLQALSALTKAADAEPRFLRPPFPARYMERTVTDLKALAAYLALALAAFEALEQRMRTPSFEGDGDAENEEAQGLAIHHGDDATFRHLLRPLGGPLAVFSAELSLSLRAAALDAAAQEGRAIDVDELNSYNIDAASSKAAFLSEYDHIARLLQPKALANPSLPRMSNVEVEAVNAVVFCLLQAMAAADRATTGVGQIGEYDYLHEGGAAAPAAAQPPRLLRRQGSRRRGTSLRRTLNLSARVMMAMEALVPAVPSLPSISSPRSTTDDDASASDVEMSLAPNPNPNPNPDPNPNPNPSPNPGRWAEQRRRRLRWHDGGWGDPNPNPNPNPNLNPNPNYLPNLDRNRSPDPNPKPASPRTYAQPVRVLVTATGPDRVGIVADVTGIVYDEGASVTSSQMLRLGGDFCLMLLALCADARRAAMLRQALHQAGATSGSERSRLGLQIVTKVLPLERRARDTASSDAVESLLGVREPAPPLSPKAAADGDLTLGEVRLVGRDAPGLVFKLTRALAAEAIGVERMQTERVRVPAGTSVALFRIPSPTRSAGEPSPKPRGSFTDADTDVFILHGAVSTHGVPAPGIQPALRSLAAELDVSVVLEWERP